MCVCVCVCGGGGLLSTLLVVLACESLHVCTVCIWRCAHAVLCGSFHAPYISFHSFSHSLQY